MKFSDVEKFFNANYAVDVSWLYLEDTLDDYEKRHGLELCPDFQRGHVWNEDQQRAYIEYILKGGMSGKDIFFNHPGWMRSFKGHLVCVDGLQRITAVRKFLSNELDIFNGHFYKDFEDKLPLTSASFKFHINNLKSKKDVLKWYIDFNSGGTVHSHEEIERVKRMMKEYEND